MMSEQLHINFTSIPGGGDLGRRINERLALLTKASYRAYLHRHRAYYYKHRHKKKRYTFRGRAKSLLGRHKANGDTFLVDETTRMLSLKYYQQRGRCALTGDKLCGDDHVDHSLPLSRGGEMGWDNLKWVKKYVNRAKGAMTDDEFLLMCKKVVAYDQSKRQSLASAYEKETKVPAGPAQAAGREVCVEASPAGEGMDTCSFEQSFRLEAD